MKIINAQVDVEIIAKTLIKPMPPSSMEVGSLTPANEININNVNKTAICANNLLRFGFNLDKKQQINKIKPKIEGIRAVGEESSIKPQKPIVMRTIEFIKLALDTFIILFL